MYGVVPYAAPTRRRVNFSSFLETIKIRGQFTGRVDVWPVHGMSRILCSSLRAQFH